ncbi:LacI family DNA-binding transcriptional regulator [Actinoplanes nipponensis]|uniref:LacI family DNA-binding transcriptional regulator n=1 Tax=Actinoplanes nipponensis TaxID=135950 RepID=UPI001EF227B3
MARAAGVAPSTVSRAFSRPGRVGLETNERVRRIAAELGYRTHSPARARPTGRTSMLALAISDITHPFYSEIVRGARPPPRPGTRRPRPARRQRHRLRQHLRGRAGHPAADHRRGAGRARAAGSAPP